MVLYKYILRNHLAPFIFSNITLICIFILQFLMKFADRLVGKGLGLFVILKLIAFNLAWMVVLVVPMSTLVATLMAFGNMSQNNEITIIKASGTSLYKMMAAPLFASIVVGYLLLIFNNDVLPDANHQAKILMQDISRQKPTLSLEPGVFSQEVSNYAILAREINQNSNELGEITIYDYSDPREIKVVTAEKGKIYFSKDQTKLIMNLENGEIHESDVSKTNLYRRIRFDRHRIAMDGAQFTFQQSALGSPRGERELSASAMREIVDSLSISEAQYREDLSDEARKYFYVDSTFRKITTPTSTANPKMVYTRLLDRLRDEKNTVVSRYKRLEAKKNEVTKYKVEIFKKYALPAACIVFVLIGAPLGTMTKRGGFGVAASISLFFFLIYWAFLIGGEKLAERDFFSAFWGMWSANILLTIAGILLTIKTVREAVTIKFTWIRKIIPKQFRESEEDTEGDYENP
ncbi:MAG TPA: LptF/LptG family permease [Ignavibacteriaceae bacterium]|nr:LptF/LptG family permease [Ignavibacteriaceae bacterium]